MGGHVGHHGVRPEEKGGFEAQRLDLPGFGTGTAVKTADMNGDGRLDIVAVNLYDPQDIVDDVLQVATASTAASTFTRGSSTS